MAVLLKRTTKALVVFCNFIFSLVGAVILGSALYVRFDSNWSSLLKSPTYGLSVVDYFAILGAVILALALLGLVGAARESRCLLVPYLTVVTISLVLQLIGVAIISNFNRAFTHTIDGQVNMTSVQQEIMARVQDQTMSIWSNGGCKVDLKALPKIAKCEDSNAQWMADFVNEKCVPDSAAAGDTPTELAFKAVASGVNVQQVLACTGSTNSLEILSGGTNQDMLIYCACQQQISEELRSVSQPVYVTMAVIAGVEVLLLLCASYLACVLHRKKHTKPLLHHANPVVGHQGINMV